MDMDMEKIAEQTARACLKHVIPINGKTVYQEILDTISQVRAEQRFIDVEKACEWWNKELREVNYGTYDETLEAFRKDMMEEQI